MVTGKFASAVLLLLAAGRLAISAQVDWAAFFRDALSPDRATQDAAREKGLGEIIPNLCREDGKIATAEIPDLAAQLEQRDSRIRTQASAVLFVVARFRPDSAAVLASAMAALIDHVDDPIEQTRQNCVNALAELKPEIPAEALPLLIKLSEDPDPVIAPGAIFGVARMAPSYPQAVEVLSRILSTESPPDRNLAGIRAIAGTGMTDVRLLAKLGELLSDKDLRVQRAALLAINRLSGQAVTLNRDAIEAFAATSTDVDMSALARRLLGQPHQ
jgi:hypothetical protein